MKQTAIPTVTCMVVLLAAAACGRQEQETAGPADATPKPAPMHTVAGVDDFRIGTADADTATITDTKQEFAPGEPIYLSMAVDDSAAGKPVTTYWYGPEGRTLAYETKSIPSDQDRLRFKQANTFDWRSGSYRAEVWVGDDKVGEQQFEIIGAG